MSDFIWADGHLGWGLFSLFVFTALWWLAADVIWRIKNIGFGQLLGVWLVVWAVVAGLIVAIFWFLAA